MKKSIIGILALSLAIASCNKDKATSESSRVFGSVDNIEDLRVPTNFNWASSKSLVTDILVEGIDGSPRAKVRIDIYDVDPYFGGKIIHSGFTNEQGRLEVPVKVASKYKEVVVLANAIGIGGNRRVVPVTGETLRAHFSGVPTPRNFDKNSSAGPTPVRAYTYANVPPGLDVFYLGTFNADGVPAGMTSVPIPQAFLDELDMTLPENNNLPCDPVRTHYLNDLFCNQVTTAKDDAEVYVTFLGEGAGFFNALAYYYYPAGSPPANTGDIDSIFVIFPHASEAAGVLQAGDRVKIGTFPKNTTIEWVLLGDAWDGDSVHYGHKGSAEYVFYGEDAFNSDDGINNAPNPCAIPADPAFNEHMISLTKNLNGEEIQIFSFEDIHFPFGDYDFNDCIFFASGDLYPSCAPELMDPGNLSTDDDDNDGIINPFDDEPNNDTVACLIAYEGTLLYEDLWPAKGDYDFNDMVSGYEIIHAINANGNIAAIRANYTLEAAGAGYNNGFGTLLSDALSSSDIYNITGRSSTGNYTQELNGVQVVPGGSSDVIVYNWDAANDIIVKAGGAYFNTLPGGGVGPAVDQNIVIRFNAPYTIEPFNVGLPPYNPFIFSNQDTSREIHLADLRPTIWNDDSRFGTVNDDSDPGTNRYYKTVPATNLPWGLDIPIKNFKWPKEKIDILTAYPDFGVWASSGGAMNTDWYLPANAAPGTTYP